jgi:hypothetical protein
LEGSLLPYNSYFFKDNSNIQENSLLKLMEDDEEEDDFKLLSYQSKSKSISGNPSV